MERSQKISLFVGLQHVIYFRSADANVLMWNQEVIRSDAVMVTASLCFPATVTLSCFVLFKELKNEPHRDI